MGTATVPTTTTTTPVAVVRPRVPGVRAAERLARWLEDGAAAHPGLPAAVRADTRARIVLVPEYRRAASRGVLADLAAATDAGAVVAVAGYGGRTRGRFAVEDAREVLEDAGARVVGTSLGLDVARIRAGGFAEEDRVLRDLVLDDVAAALSGTGRTPAPPTPRG